jgi:hypothetical protein
MHQQGRAEIDKDASLCGNTMFELTREMSQLKVGNDLSLRLSSLDRKNILS